MPKAKKAKKKTGRRVAGRRAPARKAKTGARGKSPAAGGGGAKRIAELQAENRRLREEIAALRAEREEQPAEGTSERPPALEL
jgi:hypothetical protein